MVVLLFYGFVVGLLYFLVSDYKVCIDHFFVTVTGFGHGDSIARKLVESMLTSKSANLWLAT